eukprot:TRINITY_DN3682_c0_g1_i1.p1 TRINITY_DN3682_c0_g1~~TRINITY_DN3682_c0_g1_i1.p1  ORF type:complete len:160 (+),score=11.07 TRINITY_DN3682_c0_g1_i1:54-533(+)
MLSAHPPGMRSYPQGLEPPFDLIIHGHDIFSGPTSDRGHARLTVPRDSATFSGLRAKVYQAFQGTQVFAARHLPAVAAGRSRQNATMLKDDFKTVFSRKNSFRLPKGMECPIITPLAHVSYVESADPRFTLADFDILEYASGGTLWDNPTCAKRNGDLA